MTNDEIIKAYSICSKGYAETFYNELDDKPLDRKLYDLFADKIETNGECVELGCGPGEIAVYLHNYGLNIQAIDKSDEMIKLAKKLNSKIEFSIDDVFDLSFESNTFAGVAAPFLIVNFDDEEIDKSIKEMNRILKMNGSLLISFHIGEDEELAFDDFFESGNKIVFKLHRVEKIKKIIEENGFKITESVSKEPYEGEQTTRAFIYASKIR